jgi:hypothetical protein
MRSAAMALTITAIIKSMKIAPAQNYTNHATIIAIVALASFVSALPTQHKVSASKIALNRPMSAQPTATDAQAVCHSLNLAPKPYRFAHNRSPPAEPVTPRAAASAYKDMPVSPALVNQSKLPTKVKSVITMHPPLSSATPA